jgi:hypothetical protein
MEAPALLDCLLEIAGETGLPVQRVGRLPAFEGLPQGASGVCRVRGELRVLLFDSDPLAERIRVLARALREGRSAELEGRFLPPAVRECLERAGGAGFPPDA